MMTKAKRIRLPDLVDLHVHSSASDGVYAPRDVVARAGEVGLKAIAITDHDTVGGQEEALAAAEVSKVEVVPGVEISTEFEAGTCHILGYFIDHRSEGLLALLQEAQQGREKRNREILARLQGLGFDITMDDVLRGSEDGSVTRAHFARAMMEKGHVATWDEAFEKYLGRDKPAYVYRRRILPADAIVAVRGAAGLAVLAHPRQLARSPSETESIIEELAGQGLEGVETQSPDHKANLGRRYSAVARRLGLLETGGTDWHGRSDSRIRLGVGLGRISVHYAAVEAMRARLAERS